MRAAAVAQHSLGMGIGELGIHPQLQPSCNWAAWGAGANPKTTEILGHGSLKHKVLPDVAKPDLGELGKALRLAGTHSRGNVQGPTRPPERLEREAGPEAGGDRRLALRIPSMGLCTTATNSR